MTDRHGDELRVGDMFIFSTMESAQVYVGVAYKFSKTRVYMFSDYYGTWKEHKNVIKVPFNTKWAEAILENCKDDGAEILEGIINAVKFDLI